MDGADGALRPLLAIAAGFLAGSVPISNLFARRRHVDLRHVGTGTVSGTSLYRVAGFGALAAAGVLDILKGTVGPLVAGSGHPVGAALAGGAAVAGHNWSPFLGGAGGRGISPAIGALAVFHWPGSLVLLAGMALGRVVHQTGAGSFGADLALVPVLLATDGAVGAWAGLAVVVPMLVKRVVGNAPPERPGPGVYLHRLVFDNDGETAP